MNRSTVLLITVASLGYFVDIYDLILFNIVKKESLLYLGFPESEIKYYDAFLFRWQMGGMLLGGILWGVMGDRRGRVAVLFGSILMYSLANIANAYVWDIFSYQVIRFIAGIGLAGELGAGVTLVAETMPKEKRGYGTMIIVSFGALGAVFAYLVADLFDWKAAYWVGGIMGLALLALRMGAHESGMFKNMASEVNIRKGRFLDLFSNRERALKYLRCIGMGLPVWFVVGVLVALCESYFEPVLGLTGDIEVAKAVLFCYIGLAVGDFASGFFSQIFRTRLRVVAGFLIVCLLCTLVYLFFSKGHSPAFFYSLCLLCGAGTGYWAMFVTIAAEQFGTNIRSTVASTVPNFVRGAVIPITFSFEVLANHPAMGPIPAALIVGGLCIGLALLSALTLPETFSKELDYFEV
ncbi:MAG: MFS transporter [Flavobacteriales bacterium]|nr:MFS transporter [Flavobacteriales bacterium]MCX7768583.1 MFS transporter [Flavobacteriales bacterium]MDW8409763.1 MFS transporter [Flavobacteriales bacterium]